MDRPKKQPMVQKGFTMCPSNEILMKMLFDFHVFQVLAEYLSQGCTEKSEEKLWAKFDKRLKKIPGVKVLGDKVKLTATQS